MKISELFENLDVENRRQKMRGAKLNDIVVIYRACRASTNLFNPMDYVTRSQKFAIEHAAHMMAVEDKEYHVIKLITSDIYQAPNAGEYFYDGPVRHGKIFKTAAQIAAYYED